MFILQNVEELDFVGIFEICHGAYAGIRLRVFCWSVASSPLGTAILNLGETFEFTA